MPNKRLLARWLYLVAAIVFVMIVVGGITRLTESGLSIVHWSPVSGTIPPLTQAQWIAEFEAYKRIPEGQMNLAAGMTLEGFKRIFFWEYMHRLLGRVIGLAMILPLVWFSVRRQIPAGYGWRLTALAALVVFQGAIGWWMVSSGLVERTDVSHFRLAIHLLTAFFFFSGLIWTALDLTSGVRPARLTPFVLAVLAILTVQLLFGAFTAGLDAGHAATDWPLMYGSIFPEGGWEPAWSVLGNVANNPLVIQFIHRWWAWIAAAAILLLARRVRPAMPAAPLIVGALLIAQIALGIATLLSNVALTIAAAHQGVAALLLAAVVVACHRLGRKA